LITHNIKWFLGLSVAVHAAALVTWSAHEHEPGHAGQVLLLAVRNRSGEAIMQAQELAATHTQATTDTLRPQQPTELPPVVAATPARQPQPKHPAERPRTEPPAPVRHSTPRPVQTAQAATTTTSREEQDRHLRACVMDLVAQQLTYPAIARRKGWQGVVKLELHIESDGQISDLHIDETSGYALLDEAALQSLQLANVPDAAQWLHGEAIDIIVPVEYRLIDG
jgi:protein TonB